PLRRRFPVPIVFRRDASSYLADSGSDAHAQRRREGHHRWPDSLQARCGKGLGIDGTVLLQPGGRAKITRITPESARLMVASDRAVRIVMLWVLDAGLVSVPLDRARGGQMSSGDGLILAARAAASAGPGGRLGQEAQVGPDRGRSR